MPGAAFAAGPISGFFHIKADPIMAYYKLDLLINKPDSDVYLDGCRVFAGIIESFH